MEIHLRASLKEHFREIIQIKNITSLHLICGSLTICTTNESD